MKTRVAQNIALLVVALSLAGCYIVKPKVVIAYDDECEIGFRKMVLTAEQYGVLVHSCARAECGAAVVGAVLATSLSAIVSGSIVLAGNTVFWMEKRGRCDVQEASPAVVPVETT